MTNEAQILTVSPHAIFKHVSAIHCIACKNISKQFKTKSLRWRKHPRWRITVWSTSSLEASKAQMDNSSCQRNRWREIQRLPFFKFFWVLSKTPLRCFNRNNVCLGGVLKPSSSSPSNNDKVNNFWRDGFLAGVPVLSEADCDKLLEEVESVSGT